VSKSWIEKKDITAPARHLPATRASSLARRAGRYAQALAGGEGTEKVLLFSSKLKTLEL